MNYILKYKHAIFVYFFASILSFIDIYFYKKDIIAKFISPILLSILTVIILLFVNPYSFNLFSYFILFLFGIVLSLSKLINNHLLGIILIGLSFISELFLGKTTLTAWMISIIIIRSILALGLLNKNKISSFDKYKSMPIYLMIIIMLILQSVKSFAPITDLASVISYSICDWQQGLVLLGTGYISYFGTSIVGNQIINQKNYSNLFMIFLISFGGIIGIDSVKYIFLILPILILPILNILNYLSNLFHFDNTVFSNGLAYLNNTNTFSHLIGILIAIASSLFYNISLY